MPPRARSALSPTTRSPPRRRIPSSPRAPGTVPIRYRSLSRRSPPLPRFNGSFFSNDQNAYLLTRITRQYGDAVVYRAKAPTFPDTRAGVDVTTPSQLRYWSVCEYELATERYMGCIPDFVMKVGSD